MNYGLSKCLGLAVIETGPECAGLRKRLLNPENKDFQNLDKFPFVSPEGGLLLSHFFLCFAAC